MARMNLGRVTPLWKGDYAASATYELNDIVKTADGSTYWHCGKTATTGVPVTDSTVWALLYDQTAVEVLRKEVVPYAAEITVPTNRMTCISPLTGAVGITLGAAREGLDNEWSFQITQGVTAYNVVLPVIHWGLGIAPLFAAQTTTLCRLYYMGETLCGEWVSV